MSNNTQWGGYEALNNAPKCKGCDGKGYIEHYAGNEFSQPVLTAICANCNGLKVELTSEVLEWINPDGSIKRRI